MIYQLGPWLFDSDLCLLSNDDIKKELDPLLVKLLRYFIAHPKQIISRQMLVEHVWQQTFVDDNAINRAMSELRKQLQHSELVEPLIKTHYRKGYSLQLLPKTIETQSAGVVEKDESQQKKVRPNIWLTIGVLLMVVGQFSWYFWPKQSSDYVSTADFNPELVTNDKGAEMLPLFSFDKALMAYTRTYPNTKERKVHIRRMADKQEITLVHPTMKISALAWQNQQHSLIVQAVDVSLGKCEFLLANVSGFTVRSDFTHLLDCNYQTDGYAALDKLGRYLFYTSSNNELKTKALLKYDRETKAAHALVPARPDFFGPAMPKLSQDGKWLAYLIFEKGKRVQVFLHSFETLESKRLYQNKSANYSYALDWVDSDTLRFIDYDEIVTIDINSSSIVERLSLPDFVLPYYISHRSKTDLYYTTGNTQHYGFKQVDDFSRGQDAYSIYESKQHSYFIQYDNERQQSYFISKRSGIAQVWRGNKLGVKQLTYFEDKATALSKLKLSPNSNHLLLERNNSIEILNVDSGKLRSIDFLANKQLLSIIWGENSNTLLYVEKGDDARVKRYDFITEEEQILLSVNSLSLFNSNKGVAYAATDKGLVNLVTKQIIVLPDNIIVDLNMRFKSVDDYFYATDRIKTVYRFKASDKEADVSKLDFNIHSMDVTNEHQILLGSRIMKDINIERIWW